MHDFASLAGSLPFALDDTEAAGQAFADGRGGDDRARQHADLWAYVWMGRYVTRKFLTERTGGASDIEVVLNRAYEGILRGAGRVEDPYKFPHYVSRVCKNAVLTHRERRRVTVEADDTTLPPVLDERDFEGDGAVLRRDLAAAIAVLPPAVREVARMRLLDCRSFDEIAEATRHPVPTVRTYLSKAVARLTSSPALRAHHYDDVLPPGALGADGGP